MGTAAMEGLEVLGEWARVAAMAAMAGPSTITTRPL